MRTPANIAGHPLHPMLVTLPIGMWVLSFACDVIYAVGSADPVWKIVALYAMVGGIIGALAAAIPGLIDLLSLPPGPKGTAVTHMAINLTVVALYAVNSWMRWGAPDAGGATGLPVWLSVIAIVLLLVSGWLGGKLVYLHGVGVSADDTADRRPR